MEYVAPSACCGVNCSGAMTNVPASSGLSTRYVYSMRSFPIEGGGGALVGETGAPRRAFPSAGPGAEDAEVLGVTDSGAPAEVPVPTTVMVPGTSIWKIPVYRFEGKSVSGNQREGSSKYPPSLAM